MLLLFQLVQAYVVFIKLKVFGRQKGGQNSREKSFSSVDVFKTSGKVNMILNDYQCRRQTPPRIKISNESERIWNVSQWTKVLLNAIWYFTQSGTFTCTRLTFKKNYKLFTVDVRFTLISFYNFLQECELYNICKTFTILHSAQYCLHIFSSIPRVLRRG